MSKPKPKRDKNTELPDGGADTPEGGSPPAPVMVTVVATRQCVKLNPARGGGGIAYQVGRIDGVGGPGVVIRLKDNDGGGRFSREWVPFERLRTCFSPAVLTGQPFKAHALDSAFEGRSTTNAGFLTAVIRAEGLAYEDTEHRGMSLLNGGFDTWVQGVLDAAPEKNDDGTAKLEPLVPPKRENPFSAPKDGVEKKSGGKRRELAADAAVADAADATDTADAEPCTASA
jgi:hypothetical protein